MRKGGNMPRHIPFYPELLEEGATTNEILLYGLIEASSFREGFCYASSDYMATQLGVAAGTIKNLLSSLSKRGWIQVEVEGNKRVAITPLLGITVKKKPVEKSVTEKLRSVENSDESVTQELRYRHSSVTLPSRRNDALDRGVTDKGIIINNNIIKEKINKKESDEPSAGLAGKKPASRLPIKRADVSAEEYEKEFYKLNTVQIGAISQ
jgi:uncharacterized protein YgiM (DUF1202 family)